MAHGVIFPASLLFLSVPWNLPSTTFCLIPFQFPALREANLGTPSGLPNPLEGAAKPGPVTHSDLWGPEFGEDNGASSPPALPHLGQGPTPQPRLLQSQSTPVCDPWNTALGSPKRRPRRLAAQAWEVNVRAMA